MRPEIAALEQAMERQGYIADPAIATAVFLAREMRRPLLIEGDAGVGKTEIAKVLARLLDTELDVSTALYEWNYQRQMLRIRLAEHEGRSAGEIEDLIFGRDYLLERPLLRAITRREGPPVPRLVVLADTSGSMDPYTRFLLTFVLSLHRVARRCEVFAFNTSLVRLTPSLRILRPGRIDLALERLADRVPDWSGGTRIGECLGDFAESWLDELVDGQTSVIILSDGLDRGDLAPLAGAMRAIRSRARRVLWLNPLAGDPRYEPTARAMAAALPYVDRLLPAHNLESLERLYPLLSPF